MRSTFFIYFLVTIFVVLFNVKEISGLKCGANMRLQKCEPCNQVCGQPTRSCIQICNPGNYCACLADHCLPKPNSMKCVPAYKRG